MAWTELPDELEVEEPARRDRLQRRLLAVLRQLDRRIAEVDRQRAEVDRLQAEINRLRAGINSVRAVDAGASRPALSQPVPPPPGVTGAVVPGQRLIEVSDLEHRLLLGKRWAMVRVRRARTTGSPQSTS